MNAEWLPYIHGQTNMSRQQSQSTLPAIEEQLPANNLHQIEQNVGIREFKQKHDYKSYATTNTVTRIVQTIDQDTENVSETSSVKRRVEERMKEFEFETKLQIERAQFDRKRFELEMQMKELEIQHQLREKKRNLERQLQRIALE